VTHLPFYSYDPVALTIDCKLASFYHFYVLFNNYDINVYLYLFKRFLNSVKSHVVNFCNLKMSIVVQS